MSSRRLIRTFETIAEVLSSHSDLSVQPLHNLIWEYYLPYISTVEEACKLSHFTPVAKRWLYVWLVMMRRGLRIDHMTRRTCVFQTPTSDSRRQATPYRLAKALVKGLTDKQFHWLAGVRTTKSFMYQGLVDLPEPPHVIVQETIPNLVQLSVLVEAINNNGEIAVVQKMKETVHIKSLAPLLLWCRDKVYGFNASRFLLHPNIELHHKYIVFNFTSTTEMDISKTPTLSEETWQELWHLYGEELMMNGGRGIMTTLTAELLADGGHCEDVVIAKRPKKKQRLESAAGEAGPEASNAESYARAVDSSH